MISTRRLSQVHKDYLRSIGGADGYAMAGDVTMSIMAFFDTELIHQTPKREDRSDWRRLDRKSGGKHYILETYMRAGHIKRAEHKTEFDFV